MQLIPLTDVLQTMATTTQPFNLVAVTYDRKRKTGGQLLELENCLQAGVTFKSDKKLSKAVSTQQTNVARKAPNHHSNSTRNVVLANGQTRKIHIRLIISFNGKQVRW